MKWDKAQEVITIKEKDLSMKIKLKATEERKT